MRIIVAFQVILTVVLGACSGKRGNDAAIPRRQAYPRIEMPAPRYCPVVSAGITLWVNSSIDSIATGDDGWITAFYPRHLGTLYVTVNNLSGDEASAAIDNRVERLSMNTGGAPTEIEQVENPAGLDARLIVTPSGSPTPVQFIATDHRRLLVSGTILLPDAATAPADSLAPVVDMLRRDITHLLVTLNNEATDD